ncbi:MAG: oxygen-dependent coproporphyrinogen oxidase [Alphaproteobacteria bacterium]|nr:oxygen-dependent coproporphyrinogen oxidase [Alphaproteobacteria bacterium]
MILSTWFTNLQKRICQALEEIENDYKHPNLLPGRFQFKPWIRPESGQPETEGGEDGGGGTMAILQGAVFEKAGVNVSTVFGEFSPEFRREIPGAAEDPRFWASGLSLVIHPLNPFVPAVHMNTRHIITSKCWFGGGADLTPTFEFKEDTDDFHKAMKAACDKHHPDDYDRFKKWCDDYFYLPHRKEPRGVGGIFYDYINSGSFDNDLTFTKNVGENFLRSYCQLVRRRMNKTWSPEDKYHQLIKRGKYTEFNLLYDRGTRFGLKTSGNTEAILMSLPPVASWS